MPAFSEYFIDAANHHQMLHGHHEPGLVILSIIIAIFTSGMALQTAQIARSSEIAIHKYLVIGIGSISLAGGIWSMHFIGMLSFQLPSLIRFDVFITILSYFPALIASWLALNLLSKQAVSATSLLKGGVLVGLGIGFMHYSGMAAMQTDAQLRYDPTKFALSIIIAVILSTLALSVRFGLVRTKLSLITRMILSSIVMGCAIAGMHYTGMSASYFIGDPNLIVQEFSLNRTLIAAILATFTLSISILVAFANNHIRYRQLFHKMAAGNSRMQAIVETAVDGIITINHRGIIQAFNRSAERLFGWKADEVIGKNINILMPEPDKKHHDSYLHNYQTTGVPKIIGSGREVTGLRKDGSLVPIRLAVGRVDIPGEPMFVGFVTDITQRRQLECSLRETAEQANQAAAAKTAFLANMSHEIRTPMNAIIGFTDLLLKDDLTPEQRKHLLTVHQSSRSLLALLNDILDTTKLEKGSVDLEYLNFSLREVAEEIVATMNLAASTKGLLLELIYPASTPDFFIGDPLRIRQIVTNLLGNAIKFTEQGKVSLIIHYQDNLLHIQVKDTGIGMSTQQLKHIFDPFAQADNSISRRFGGTGLGTTISRQLIELMGGRIHVDSAIGLGSIFHVYLPLEIGLVQEATQSSSAPVELPPLDILVADDVPQNIDLLSSILQRNGHRVRMVSNGKEALAMFKSQRFDVILMDIHMPHMDGLEAAQRIREHEQVEGIATTPIIALTASVMEADHKAAEAAGMNGFAAKPLDTIKLANEIARVLKLLPTHHEQEQTTLQHRPLALIDWPTGIALWGDKARMVKAILAFMQDAPERFPLPSVIDDNTDWTQLAASLHGIKGAAGNLGLASTSALAGQLEQQVKSGQHQHIAPLLPQLTQLMHAAKLSASSQYVVPTTHEPVAMTTSAEQLHQARATLLGCLLRHELDDDSLKLINHFLKQEGLHKVSQAFNNAIDLFDFEQACELLSAIELPAPIEANV
jgi:PAS domain S-box-containing protein